MSLRIAIQMDPPALLNAAGDSTIVLALEAQKRGHTLYYYHPSWLTYSSGKITTRAHPITFFDSTERWFELGEETSLNLAEADVVLMRQDPPYDMAYLTATYLLEKLEGKTLVANNSHAVRNLPEKLFPLMFEQYMPPSLIASDKAPILQFLAEQKDIVVKPLYGFGGHDVFRLREGGDNTSAILETLLQHRLPLMAQKFLPEVASEDRRIILMNGEFCGATGRIPATGEIRANFRVGGSAAAVELSPKQQEICTALGPVLREHGIYFAGIDVIGDHLTEINITSPTGLRAIKNLYGTTPETAFWNAIEAAL